MIPGLRKSSAVVAAKAPSPNEYKDQSGFVAHSEKRDRTQLQCFAGNGSMCTVRPMLMLIVDTKCMCVPHAVAYEDAGGPMGMCKL